MIRKGKLYLTWVHLSLFVPLALYLWFAWQGFSKMAVDQPMSWRWYADLTGGLSSLIIVGGTIYGIIKYNKKFLAVRQKK